MRNNLYMICLVLVMAFCPHPASGQTVNETWVQSYHKEGTYDNVPIALAVAGNGNVVVTGTSADQFGLDSWLTVAWSSSGNILWTQSFHGPVEFADEQPNAIAVDANGNTYVAGVILGEGAANQDYLTIKYSTEGVPVWTRTYNGTGSGNDGATAIVLDGDGNVIVTGLSQGTSGLSSLFDCVTIKYSPDGEQLWVNRYNGPGNNEDSAKDVAVDAAGNVYVAGLTQTQQGAFDYLTLAISRDGQTLWAKQYNGPGNGSDYGQALAVDANGKVFVTGWSDSGGNTSIAEYATVAYSPAGDLLWANRYHANNLQQGSYNLASDIAVDNEGNVFVTGGAGGGPAGGMATLKYSSAGTLLWTEIYKGPSPFAFNDDGRAVAVQGNGNVVVTGRSYAGNSDAGDFATVAYSNAGAPLWTQRYNGPANGNDTPLNRKSLGLGPYGSVYVTGLSDMDPSAGQQYQFVVVKYAPSNTAPAVEISSPLNGASFTAPANIAIHVNASDSDGSVTRVVLRSGESVIGSVKSEPFEFSWNGVAPGNYTLTAVATDDLGATTTSAPVSISVTNSAPVISITSPAEGSSYTAPATIEIDVSASDSDGSIAQVAVYSGQTLLAAINSAPFEISWENVSPGNYTLTAKATDNLGATTTSDTVHINVSIPPPPAAPTGLVATAVSRSRINLTWTDNSGDELGFKIERSTKNKPFKQVAVTDPNVTAYADKGLSAGQKYTYRVRAYNSSGDSAYSDTAKARTSKRLFSSVFSGF